MATTLPARVTQDPSDGFRLLPPDEVAEFDVRISFDVLSGDRIRARMSGPAVPVFDSGELRADLAVFANEVRSAAAWLVERWRLFFVDYQPTTEDGKPVRGRNRPYASATDLTSEPEQELFAVLSGLANDGAYVLFDVLLSGEDSAVAFFRANVAQVLAREGLRIRFDSAELFPPWPMLCVRPDDLSGGGDQSAAELSELFALFLGFRHQIEHAGDVHPRVRVRAAEPEQPAVSLNHDTAVGAAIKSVVELAAALSKDTRFTKRTTYRELERDLGQPDMDEQLMYFWCHGGYKVNGAAPAQLVIRLTDQTPFDGQTVDRLRTRHKGLGFSPFVVLNACQAGAAAADVDRAFLGKRLITHGARGVLGPQIEMPQRFAADYALAFVKQYLRGGEDDTAGKITHQLARLFATRYHNPLGFAYALHSGMDARIRRKVEPEGA